MNIYLGLAILFGVMFLRWVFGYWRRARLRRWWNKGQDAIKLDDLVTAEVAFRECVRLAPIYAPVRRILGRVLARRRKLDEAEDHLRMGAELEPRNAAGHLELALFLAANRPGRAEEAIDAFAKAIEYAPALRKTLSQENSLAPLRHNERFQKLLKDA